MKGRYPWRVGATSFVLPAGVSENVDYLADRADDIQLLFFESASQTLLPHKVDVSYLQNSAQEHNVTYTVHLPTDLSLGGDNRQAREGGVVEVLRLMEELAPLEPRAFDLHLNMVSDVDKELWIDRLDHSLTLLADRLGRDRDLIAVENIDYSFSQVRSLVLEHGFSLCLDIGHALRYGDDVSQIIEDMCHARHIHYHGVAGGRDHRAISSSSGELSRRLGAAMAAENFDGVFTVEVYTRNALEKSLKELAAAWSDFEIQKQERICS